MRILSIVRTTALALAATAVVGATQLSPALASDGNTEHFRVTYAIPHDKGQTVNLAQGAYGATASDAAAPAQAAAPAPTHRISATERWQQLQGW